VNKKLLFFLCNVIVLSYASERSSTPVSFLDMCTRVNKRFDNQDRRVFCRLPNKGLLFGGLDGHVADEVADHVSYTFPSSFYRYLEKSSEKEAFSKAFADAEKYALNNLIGGSTAVFTYIHNGIAHVANVGDSRAVFGTKDGVAFATQDQKPHRADEHERIIQANGIVYREKNELGVSMGQWRINCLAMSRSIGDGWCKGREVHGESLCLPRERIEVSNQTSSFLEQWRKSAVPNLVLMPKMGQVIAEPEYTQISLTDAHRWLIIATDGLWDVVNNEEALAMVQNYYDEHKCIEGVSTVLSDYAIERGSKDNITVLVVDLLDQIGGKK
jgi:protein phosphatase 1L